MYNKVTKEAMRNFARKFGGDYFMGRIVRGEEIIGIQFEGEYIVMNDGTIYRYYDSVDKWKQIKPKKMSSGYHQTCIHGNVVLTHRIIASCFCPNPKGYPIVNHLNGDKFDNRAENLEWCTYSMNMYHAYAELDHPRLGTKRLHA